MKTYISVNVVSQALLLLRTMQLNNCFTTSTLPQLRLPYGVNRNTSLDFMHQCNWVRIEEGVITLTDSGDSICSIFDGLSISQALWMYVLRCYIISSQPAWARRIPFGRKEAYIFMSEEEKLCFREAGLMMSYETDVIAWWDSLAETERQKQDSCLNNIGRHGERLTMAYEEHRTGYKPDWRALETNLAGYDIISRRDDVKNDRILIEVKTSTQSLTDAFMIISRNEWNTAMKENNHDRYLFYLWSISEDKTELAIIRVCEMIPFIPIDSGSGAWDSVKIPFSTFRTHFRQVSCP